MEKKNAKHMCFSNGVEVFVDVVHCLKLKMEMCLYMYVWMLKICNSERTKTSLIQPLVGDTSHKVVFAALV